MDIIKDVLCRLLMLTDSSRNFYMPASANLQLLPFNVSSASDLCLTPSVKEDSNLAIELPEDRDLLPLLNASETCKTPSCVKAAADILSFIDETVKPCDDFYKFSCGGWLKRQSYDSTTFGHLGSVSKKKLRVIFERKLNGDQRDFVRQMKALYDACMDDNSIKKLGIKPLLETLKDFGGWPVIEGKNWNSNSFDWIDARSRILEIGAKDNFLVDVFLGEDPRNNSIEIIQLAKANSKNLENTFLNKGPDEKESVQYFESMIKIAKALGANESTSKKQLKEVFEFESRLINLTLENWEEDNDTYCTIHELKEMIPQIDWRKLYKTVWKREISETENVLISDLNYIFAVTNFITNTTKRVLANYMVWKFVQKSFPMLGLDWTPSREKCFDYVYEPFRLILDSIYIRQYFPENIKKAALEITTYVKNEYINMLGEIDWMDEESRANSVKRVNDTKLQMDYPKNLLNDTFLSEIFANVTYNNESFFYNNLKTRKWDNTVFWHWFRKYFFGQQEMWLPLYKIIDSKAGVNEAKDKITISTALLQNHMFSKDRPRYLNFGTLGFIYGHEISHGFNGEVRTIISFDNLWSNETNEHFKKKAGCFLKQYAKYTVRGMQVNSSKTQEDNIADNLGHELAYLAYQSWVRDNGREPALPGLKYTPNQLFWISAASVLCMKFSPDTEAKRIKEDGHSPPQFRVIGSMSNNPDFSKDFNCPPNSAMNPKKKCRVWRNN